MLLCGDGQIRDEAMWLVREDFAIWASKQNQVWDIRLTGGITAMEAGKSIKYDAEGLASGLLRCFAMWCLDL